MLLCVNTLVSVSPNIRVRISLGYKSESKVTHHWLYESPTLKDNAKSFSEVVEQIYTTNQQSIRLLRYILSNIK